MDNIINLEQLDYRDQLIKEYIDEHSSGGGSSDYMPARLATTRVRSDDGSMDSQKLYLGVPEGTDMTGISIK